MTMLTSAARLARPLNRLALAALPLGLSLLFTVAIIVLVGAPPLLLPLVLLGAALFGAAWGWLVGALKVYGNVHEIFGGLGLNFVAMGLTNYLIFGPWSQPGRATVSGTEPYPTAAWLPTLDP